MRRASPDQYVPQCGSLRRQLLAWLILGAGALLITALIVGAPLAQAKGIGVISVPLYQAFSHVCHQAPERSFFLAGNQFAVCSRCTGLYFGFAALVILYPLFTSLRRTQTPERKWLFIAAVPLAIDFGLGLFGVWDNTHWSRFITGALLGGTAVLYVMPALVQLSLRAKKHPFTAERTQLSELSTNIRPEGYAAAPSDYSAPERRI